MGVRETDLGSFRDSKREGDINERSGGRGEERVNVIFYEMLSHLMVSCAVVSSNHCTYISEASFVFPYNLPTTYP